MDGRMAVITQRHIVQGEGWQLLYPVTARTAIQATTAMASANDKRIRKPQWPIARRRADFLGLVSRMIAATMREPVVAS